MVKHISSESNVLVQDFGKWFKSQMDNVVPMKRIKRLKHPFAWRHYDILGEGQKFITNIKSLCDARAGILEGYKFSKGIFISE